MIFKSPIRNLVYVIQPVHKNVISGIVTHSDGLRVVFTGNRDGTFDSSTISDPDKRKLAEDYLQKHPDNGVRYYLVPDDAPEAPAVLNTCIAAVVGGGVCGKLAEKDSDYCADCARTLTHA